MLGIEGIPLKKGDNITIGKKLGSFLKKQYDKAIKERFSGAISGLEKTRNELLRKNEPSSEEYLEMASRFMDLAFHFPLDDTSFKLKMNFSWSDSFMGKSTTNVSSAFEIAGLLFNACACITQEGSKAALEDGGECTNMAKTLGQAAGIFAYLRENIVPRIIGRMTQDLNVESLARLEEYCLVLAQECMVKKVILGKMKKSSIVRVISAAEEMIEELEKKFQIPWKGMKDKLKMKLLYYKSLKVYYQSLVFYGKTEIGNSLGCVKKALEICTRAKKLRVPKMMKNKFEEHQKEVERKLKDVQRENERVYFETAADPSGLPQPKPFKLAKLKEFLKVSVENPFKALFPIHVLQGIQEYKENVNKKLLAMRPISEHRAHLKNSMTQQGLPGSIMAHTSVGGYPKEVHDKIDGIRKSGGAKQLTETQDTVKSMASESSKLCEKLIESLKKEENEDNAMRRTYGVMWNRLPSASINQSLMKQVNECVSKINQAAAADGLVDKKVMQNKSYFVYFDLSKEQLDSQIPKGKSETSETTQNMKEVLKQLDELFDAEVATEEQIKQMQGDDASLQKKFLESQDMSILLKNELEEVDKQIVQLQQNTKKEDELVQQLFQLNVQFVKERSAQQQNNPRTQAIQGMYYGITKFEEILGNLNQGINFYCSIQDFIKKLETRVNDFILSRDIESKDLVKQIQQNQKQPQQQPQMNYGYPPQYGQQMQQNQYYNPQGYGMNTQPGYGYPYNPQQGKK